ncbi:hypothetical protein [Roseovarius pelagicus]
MGCGLAYQLAHEGWTDVILLGKRMEYRITVLSR